MFMNFHCSVHLPHCVFFNRLFFVYSLLIIFFNPSHVTLKKPTETFGFGWCEHSLSQLPTFFLLAFVASVW
ncbi:hypothetical protein EDC94DRAFT_621145 [Helicostylum pulchrum]|nr:hypothetical protein EDC94DRAFT_621145 [Helicostylum pulchrum]